MSVVALLLLSPLAPPFVPGEIGGFIHLVYGSACHQIPSRSFHVDGIALAVCQRCTGIYLGVLAGSMLALTTGLLRRSGRRWSVGMILAAILLLGVDWMAGLAGFGMSGAATRFATGLFFGGIAGIFLGDAIDDIASGRGNTENEHREPGACAPANVQH